MVSERRKSLTVLQRGRFDIMASVLSGAVSGTTKTYIMRKCNLSHRQVKAYLDILLDKDLLKGKPREGKGNPTKIYVTTEKGKAFLRAYSNLKATVKEIC